MPLAGADATTEVLDAAGPTEPDGAIVPPADASTTPADASTAPADASTTPADASTTPADASTAPADASTAPADASTAPADASTAPADASTAPADASTTPAGKPIVILIIGDGMGPSQLQAAAMQRPLRMPALPVRGQLITSSFSGITDSAAAATAMATGIKTHNGVIGLDRNGVATQTLVELAHNRGLATGIVTTASLPHATPAAFTAHQPSRGQYSQIAEQQVTITQPNVLLGGGSMYYADHYGALEATGYQVVTDRDALQLATPDSGNRLAGIFANEHMDFTLDRASDSSQPTLRDMATTALEFLDTDPDGFFLMIEGAHIDMASHGNDLDRAVAETLALDDTVSAVMDWAQGRSNVTVLVTADHETGGLDLTHYPTVSWRWGDHTNARVDLFGAGPGSELFHAEILDHTWVHAALAARITGSPVVEPSTPITPDGVVTDLRHRVAQQQVITGFGAGFNQLDALYLDADAHGLGIGLQGLFQWQENSVVLLVDTDFGANTGIKIFPGALTDTVGRVDQILSSIPLTVAIDGFGADVAVVSWGGSNPRRENLWDDGGIRGLQSTGNLPWLSAATNFGEGVRVRHEQTAPVSGEGFEAFVPWETIYPELGGAVPPGATVAVLALLVNDNGDYVSNQLLPPLPPGSANPGATPFTAPGVVVFRVDSDTNGVGDGDSAPLIHHAQ